MAHQGAFQMVAKFPVPNSNFGMANICVCKPRITQISRITRILQITHYITNTPYFTSPPPSGENEAKSWRIHLSFSFFFPAFPRSLKFTFPALAKTQSMAFCEKSVLASDLSEPQCIKRVVCVEDREPGRTKSEK